jgi:hypothetical protein
MGIKGNQGKVKGGMRRKKGGSSLVGFWQDLVK